MNKRNLMIIAGIIIVIAAVVTFNLLKKDSKEKTKDVAYNIASLNELFPSDEIKQTYTDGNQEYEVTVKKAVSKDGVTSVVTEYETKVDNVVTTVQTTYEMTSDKLIESGKYISNNETVSIIYPTELIVGLPYVSMTWKSADGLITNTVVSMKNNQVTIESVKTVEIYEDEKTTATKKDYKETRVYEKGKGIVLYRTEIVGDSNSVYEKKLKD
jgi:hypothetical protein